MLILDVMSSWVVAHEPSAAALTFFESAINSGDLAVLYLLRTFNRDGMSSVWCSLPNATRETLETRSHHRTRVAKADVHGLRAPLQLIMSGIGLSGGCCIPCAVGGWNPGKQYFRHHHGVARITPPSHDNSIG